MINVDHTIKFSTVWYNNIILLNNSSPQYNPLLQTFCLFPGLSVYHLFLFVNLNQKRLSVFKTIKPYILYLSSCLLYSCRYIFIPEWKLISPSGINSTFAYLAARGGATIWGKFRVHESLHSFCNTFFKVKL